MSISPLQRKHARLWLHQILDAPSRYWDLTFAVLVILRKTAQFLERELG